MFEIICLSPQRVEGTCIGCMTGERDVIVEFNGVVPVDAVAGEDSPFKVGPVKGLDTVKKLLAATAKADKDAVRAPSPAT